MLRTRERSTAVRVLARLWCVAAVWMSLAQSGCAGAPVQSAGAERDEIRWTWSVTELSQGSGVRLECGADAARLVVLSERVFNSSDEAAGSTATGPAALPTWLVLGEPIVLGDRRYPADLSRALLGLRSGARLQVDLRPVPRASGPSPEAAAPHVELGLELRVLSPGMVANRRWRFGPDFMLRAEQASRLVADRDLSRAESAARLRLHDLADRLDEHCAPAGEQTQRCSHGPLAQALAVLVLGRGAGTGAASQSLRIETLRAARGRYAASACDHDDVGATDASATRTLVCLLRCAALADAYQVLPAPQIRLELRRHAAALEPRLNALTPHDDPLLVEWALRLALATDNGRSVGAPRLDEWIEYMQDELAHLATLSGVVETPRFDVGSTYNCPDEDFVAPAGGALARWAECAPGAARRAASVLALDDCVDCARALHSYRATMLELTAAHARGGGAWERMQRELLLPAVLLTEAGVDTADRSFVCRNAQLIEAAARASVLSSRWSMGHSYAPPSR